MSLVLSPSQSSLRSLPGPSGPVVFLITLVVNVYLTFACCLHFWMLFSFTNLLTSRSSLRSQHISQSHLSLDVSLTFECFIRLWMLFWLMNLTARSSLLNTILIYETPYFTELASLAKYLLIILVVQCFSHFPMLYSS